jgi:glycogen operon protein
MAEWNDRFRDAMRNFWLESPRAGAYGEPMASVRELTTRLSGSADLFGHSDPPLMRGPVASINFITSHDGFTMADLVAYDHKHNEANLEDNRDGTTHNRSWNHGVEGHAPDGDDAGTEPWASVLPLRRRSQRNLMAMLALSAGTPMLTAGDEFGRTQGGNNNAYCQDSEISWIDWNALDDDLLATTRHLLALRRTHAALRTDSFFLGTPRPGEKFPDLLWFTRSGNPMKSDDWDDVSRRRVQMLRPGPGPEDADVLVVINGTLDVLGFTLPAVLDGALRWEQVWSSDWEGPKDPSGEILTFLPGDKPAVKIEPLTVQVYIAPRA